MRLTGVALSAALGLGSGTAFAQEAWDAAPAPTPVEAPFPRGRASFGGLTGGSSFYNGNYNGNVDVIGAYFRVGLQWTRAFGTEVEVAGGSSFGITSNVHGAFFFDFLPSDGFAFALGPVIGQSYGVNLAGDPCPGPYIPGAAPCQFPTGNPTTYVAGAARVDFLPWHDVSGRGTRRGLDLAVEIQVGSATSYVPLNASSLGLAAYFMIGYAAY